MEARKRKHGDHPNNNPTRSTDKEVPRQPKDLSAEQRALAQSEAEDLDDLKLIASEAIPIEFDNRTGRPIPGPQNRSNDKPIEGILKLSRDMLLKHDKDLLTELKQIHGIVKRRVRLDKMVPWAGLGGDTTRLRAFGFLGADALARLDNSGAVRLHAPEKQGAEALEDERANRRAICVLHPTRERLLGNGTDRDTGGGNRPLKPGATLATKRTRRTVNPTLVADKLCAAILAGNQVGIPESGSTVPTSAVLSSEELIAYQTNLHNGAKHLGAHLDAPLHEGFGKVIVTVAIRGSATILLIGKGDDVDDDKDDESEQPAWKFRVEEGEAYVLSGNARNICLHAVLADDNVDRSTDGGGGGDRESLNLRFGIHTIEEAENEIKRHWPDLW